MATIKMPIKTILSVLPACESGNAGVGLAFPGVGEVVAATGAVVVARLSLGVAVAVLVF